MVHLKQDDLAIVGSALYWDSMHNKAVYGNLAGPFRELIGLNGSFRVSKKSANSEVNLNKT